MDTDLERRSIHPQRPAGEDFLYSPDPLAAPGDMLERINADISLAGEELPPDEDLAGSIGATMFDLPSSEDNSVTVLLPREHLQRAPSQALVRIKSRDRRRYLGIVSRGPFAEPDSLRGDSPMLVNVAAHGGIYLPPHHGRIQVTLLGEEREGGGLGPPLLRPLPNSPVHVLDEHEAAAVLGTEGDIRLGLASNYTGLEVRIPSGRKDVLPRHTAVLGTTGGGKSTTIAGLIQQAQAADMAVILLDVEGEYTHLHEPTDQPGMLAALAARNLEATPVAAGKMAIYHLVGREPANPGDSRGRAFSLRFDRLSPYAISEILALNEAQDQRFHKAYDIARQLLRDLGIFPARGDRRTLEAEEQEAQSIDEFERGCPRLTLRFLMDVAGACLAQVEKGEQHTPSDDRLKTEEGKRVLDRRVRGAQLPAIPSSWRVLLGRLARLNRLGVFDSTAARPLDYAQLLRPGFVSVIDLSDAGLSEMSNIVIADLLRGVQEAQDEAYDRHEKRVKDAAAPARALIVVEEAHEFLSAERIEKMPTLFQQVARIAKRGRKRWLGLVFVTQLPQHLPRQVFGLVNSYILHKITDPQVISGLQKTVSGIDESLWSKLPGLAPGQAIVSFPHMTVPLLVSIDPAASKLRLVD